MSAAPAAAKILKHEEVFLARYDQLLKWATHLTRSDRELARDLVQESFLQFALSRSDLNTINNIDSYLYGIVRNSYLSYLRRSPQRFQLPLDLEITEGLGLTFDPRQQMKAKDRLVAICQRACVRKETSVAASLLILRFFHGYLPSEIAKLTHRSRNVVDVQLKLARWELTARDDEGLSGKIKKAYVPEKSTRKRIQPTVDLLTELRCEIFAARKGDCFNREQFSRLQNTRTPVPRNKVSHLVSCVHCLDEASRILGLPSLRERNVLDQLGRSRQQENPHHDALLRSLALVMSWAVWAGLTFVDLVI